MGANDGHLLRKVFPYDDRPRKKPSVRDVTSWLTRHPDCLNDDQAQQLKQTLARCPALDRAGDLSAPHTFADGLGQDLDPAVARLSRRYSSGEVEDHNNVLLNRFAVD
ncbi:hypothetical protein [Streptomyces sp. NPDC002994]|uniref:hypothetical protein n=1 Tax=Streptomyces sp. NPDC002994 TaxID=3154441 RepID=UPI0033AEDC2E